MVATYMRGAELQKETNPQRAEIRRALRDMLREDPGDPDWLKRQRYADHQGHEGQWSVTTLIQKYFVPSRPASLDESTFFQDVGAPEAQDAVRGWIRRLMEAPSGVNLTCPDHVKAAETMELTKGWELFPGSPERSPQNISLFEDHPSKQTSLKPDNGDESSDFFYWSGLDPKGQYWVTCGYGGGGTSLAKALPSGFTYCEASYGNGEVRLACYAGP